MLPFAQLFELTGISPERQKITVGAKQITENTDLASMGLKEKQVCCVCRAFSRRRRLARGG
jgi:hypothetical protein